MTRAERVLELLSYGHIAAARSALFVKNHDLVVDAAHMFECSPATVAATVCDIFELRSIQGESVEVTARRIRRLIDPEEDT
jgi:hypothetical protein